VLCLIKFVRAFIRFFFLLVNDVSGLGAVLGPIPRPFLAFPYFSLDMQPGVASTLSRYVWSAASLPTRIDGEGWTHALLYCGEGLMSFCIVVKDSCPLYCESMVGMTDIV
jgi:hypothetical protein